MRAAAVAMVTMLALATAAGAHDWNDGQVTWKGLDEGLAQAKKDKKPVCLVIYTEWCPHCKNFAKVFHDAKIVEKARGFVMVRLDQDQHKAQAQKYAPDGGYVPRTIFLASDGTIASDVHAPRPQYKHFFDENHPASLGAGMDAAVAKLGGKS